MMTSQGHIEDHDGDFPPNPFRYDEDDEDITPSDVPQQAAQVGAPVPAPTDGGFGGPPRVPLPPPISSVPVDVDDPYATSFEPVNTSYVGSGSIDQVPAQQTAPSTMSSNVSLDQEPKGFLQRITACVSVENYKAHFDVDTADIVERVIGSVTLCNSPDEFRQTVLGVGMNNGKSPDLYGPYWITLTLMFFVAMTSNMHMYIHSNNLNDFEYDIRHLVRAMSVLSFFTIGLPVVFFFTFRFFGIQVTLIELVCLYGYSLVPYFPAVIMCLIPWGFFGWLFLLAATGVSVMLVLRNVAGPVLASEISQSKAGPILVAVLLCHFVFFLVLKLSFYHKHAH